MAVRKTLRAPRLEKMAVAPGRLLLNLSDPKGAVRRLYINAVLSVALYKSPMWTSNVVVNCRILVRRSMHHMAIRITQAYKTVSYAAAIALTGVPPWELVVLEHAEVYRRVRAARLQSEDPLQLRAVERIKEEERRRVPELARSAR